MKETRSVRNMNVFAWFGILVGAIFLVLLVITLTMHRSARLEGWVPAAFLASLLIAFVVTLGIMFLRWVMSGRNFLRLLLILLAFASLAVLVWGIENWRGERAWQQHVKMWSAKGEPFTLAQMVPPSVPEEENFAATPLLSPIFEYSHAPTGVVWRDTNAIARLGQISPELHMPRGISDYARSNVSLVLGNLERGTYADLEASAAFYRGNTNYPQAPPGTAAAEVVLIALRKFEAELDELRKAAASRASSRFPIEYDYEPSWGILLPHLTHVKNLVRLVNVRATALLDLGQSDAAFEDLQLAFHLADSIRNEPLLINHLVRIATLSLNLQTIREGLVRHAWSDEHLSRISELLAEMNLLAEHKQAIRGERVWSIAGLDYLRRQGIRAATPGVFGEGDMDSDLMNLFRFAPAGWFYQNMLTISQFHQRYFLPSVDEEAGLVFPDRSEAGARVVQSIRPGPYTIFAKILLPALQRANLRAARIQTFMDATIIACALERHRLAHRKVPDSLHQLVPDYLSNVPTDVITGAPLKWRLQDGSGYAIYSVGWNQKDDGGQVAFRRTPGKSVEPTEGDWVWEITVKEELL